MASTNKLIAIVGPTASGKSNLAIKTAKQFNGELICADSRSIYKGLDIGTAKPTIEQQKQVPHHLIDIIYPNQKYTVAQFKKQANKIICDINKRGNIPIIVGGTGLYVDSVLFDYQFGSKVKNEIRESLDKKSLEQLQSIAKSQEISEEDVNYKNRRHLQRAIERGGIIKHVSPIRKNTLVIGIDIDKEELKNRICKRIDSMVSDGFVDELIDISGKYGWDCEAMTGIGYRAFKEYVGGLITLQEAKDKFIKGDINLAKRQKTWFKRNKSIQWINNTNEALNLVQQFLNT